MWPFSRSRIHESVAIAAVFAMALALNAFWTVNLISARWFAFQSAMTLSDAVGPVTGFYLLSALIFAASWIVLAVFFRGRDCAPYREKAFWFFFASTMAFLVFTFPPVYSLSVL